MTSSCTPLRSPLSDIHPGVMSHVGATSVENQVHGAVSGFQLLCNLTPTHLRNISLYFTLIASLYLSYAALRAFNPLFLNMPSAFHPHRAHAHSSALYALPTLLLYPHLPFFSFMKPPSIWVSSLLPHLNKGS